MEPDVSEPSANGTSPAPTALPEPLDEPPAHLVRSHGLSPGPCRLADGILYPPPPANSTIPSLPISTAPAFASRFNTAASSSNICATYRRAPQVVGFCAT